MSMSQKQRIGDLKAALRETVQNLNRVVEEGEIALKRAQRQLERLEADPEPIDDTKERA